MAFSVWQLPLNSWNRRVKAIFFILLLLNYLNDSMLNITIRFFNLFNQRPMYCPIILIQEPTSLGFFDNIVDKLIYSMLKQFLIIIYLYHKLIRTDNVVKQKNSSLSNGRNKRYNFRHEFMASINIFTFRNFFFRQKK